MTGPKTLGIQITNIFTKFHQVAQPEMSGSQGWCKVIAKAWLQGSQCLVLPLLRCLVWTVAEMRLEHSATVGWRHVLEALLDQWATKSYPSPATSASWRVQMRVKMEVGKSQMIICNCKKLSLPALPASHICSYSLI